MPDVTVLRSNQTDYVQAAIAIHNADITAHPSISAGTNYQTLEAGEPLLLGDAVYVDPINNKLYKALNDTIAHASVVGFVLANTALGLSTNFSTTGVITVPTWTLTPNSYYFLSSTPGQIALLTPSVFVTQVGYALTPTKLQVSINQPIRL